ncbi:hypothetical protein G3446_19460, partial [Thiorhodococcus minor]|nr:hypothetical protein [Thiorhodococcus minor]
MLDNIPLPSIPVARARMLAPWLAQVQSLGAPAEALLIRSGIHPDLLAHP